MRQQPTLGLALYPPAERLSFQAWEHAIQRGNAAARIGSPNARRLLKQALGVAEQLLGRADACLNADACIAALVVSRLNMADLCLLSQAREEGVEHLCRAHHTLTALMHCADSALPLRQAAWRHSRETLAALMAYRRDHGEHAAIARAIQQGHDLERASAYGPH